MTEKRDIRELALEALGFASLNAMQDDMLRVFPEGRDILLLAPTGSGKTLAYLLPLWQKGGRTLIIAPSRELVQQIADVWQRLHTDIRCVACYGGHDTRECPRGGHTRTTEGPHRTRQHQARDLHVPCDRRI